MEDGGEAVRQRPLSQLSALTNNQIICCKKEDDRVALP